MMQRNAKNEKDERTTQGIENRGKDKLNRRGTLETVCWCQKRRNRVRIYGDDKYGGRDKKDIKGGEFEE